MRIGRMAQTGFSDALEWIGRGAPGDDGRKCLAEVAEGSPAHQRSNRRLLKLSPGAVIRMDFHEGRSHGAGIGDARTCLVGRELAVPSKSSFRRRKRFKEITEDRDCRKYRSRPEPAAASDLQGRDGRCRGSVDGVEALTVLRVLAAKVTELV